MDIFNEIKDGDKLDAYLYDFKNSNEKCLLSEINDLELLLNQWNISVGEVFKKHKLSKSGFIVSMILEAVSNSDKFINIDSSKWVVLNTHSLPPLSENIIDKFMENIIKSFIDDLESVSHFGNKNTSRLFKLIEGYFLETSWSLKNKLNVRFLKNESIDNKTVYIISASDDSDDYPIFSRIVTVNKDIGDIKIIDFEFRNILNKDIRTFRSTIKSFSNDIDLELPINQSKPDFFKSVEYRLTNYILKYIGNGIFVTEISSGSEKTKYLFSFVVKQGNSYVLDAIYFGGNNKISYPKRYTIEFSNDLKALINNLNKINLYIDAYSLLRYGYHSISDIYQMEDIFNSDKIMYSIYYNYPNINKFDFHLIFKVDGKIITTIRLDYIYNSLNTFIERNITEYDENTYLKTIPDQKEIEDIEKFKYYSDLRRENGGIEC